MTTTQTLSERADILVPCHVNERCDWRVMKPLRRAVTP